MPSSAQLAIFYVCPSLTVREQMLYLYKTKHGTKQHNATFFMEHEVHSYEINDGAYILQFSCSKFKQKDDFHLILCILDAIIKLFITHENLKTVLLWVIMQLVVAFPY
jgi:hypothetical protein